MTEEELRNLEQAVKRNKRIASEWASKLHDLVEDRLPAAYLDIPEITQDTFDAGKAWAETNDRLRATSE